MKMRFFGSRRTQIGVFLGILAVMAAMVFVPGPAIDAPGNAVVMVNMASRTYFAPPCLPNPADEGIATLENAKRLGLAPDEKCLNSGGFVQTGRTAARAILERVGLVPPILSRWNPNGSWNW